MFTAIYSSISIMSFIKLYHMVFVSTVFCVCHKMFLFHSVVSILYTQHKEQVMHFMVDIHTIKKKKKKIYKKIVYNYPYTYFHICHPSWCLVIDKSSKMSCQEYKWYYIQKFCTRHMLRVTSAQVLCFIGNEQHSLSNNLMTRMSRVGLHEVAN